MFFLSSLLLSRRSRICAVTQGFFFWRYLQRISLVVSVTAVLEVVINESMSVSSSFMMVRGTNISPIMAWKVSNTLRSFSFSRSNLSFGLLILFSDEGGRSSPARHGHFQCLLLGNLVFWHWSLLIGSASSRECNQSSCVVIHFEYARSIFWMLCDGKMCLPTQDR